MDNEEMIAKISYLLERDQMQHRTNDAVEERLTNLEELTAGGEVKKQFEEFGNRLKALESKL